MAQASNDAAPSETLWTAWQRPSCADAT